MGGLLSLYSVGITGNDHKMPKYTDRSFVTAHVTLRNKRVLAHNALIVRLNSNFCARIAEKFHCIACLEWFRIAQDSNEGVNVLGIYHQRSF